MGLCLDKRDILVMHMTQIPLSSEFRLCLCSEVEIQLYIVTVLPLTFCIPLPRSLCCFWIRGCAGEKVEWCQGLCPTEGQTKGKLPVCVWEVFQAYGKEKREITANCQPFQRVKQRFTVIFFKKTQRTKNSLLQFDLMNPEYLIICVQQFPKLWLSSFAVYLFPFY